ENDSKSAVAQKEQQPQKDQLSEGCRVVTTKAAPALSNNGYRSTLDRYCRSAADGWRRPPNSGWEEALGVSKLL
ncbi:MAG: hypothetical protein KIA58_09960, partial [Winkia neuii]|uniref:hypothetical protein n=1 Tax=Winkia neuii TaxID=33007 RepID=UPI00241C1EA8